MKEFKPAGYHSMCLTVLKKIQICELTQIFFPWIFCAIENL